MQKKRFEELEGLRGIAAIVVAIYHFLLAFYLFSFLGPGSAIPNMRYENNLYGNPIMAFLSGTFAVAIFFVLSGFVLSIGFFQTKDINIIRKLAAKRYIRLMFPALASTLLCFIVILLGLSKLHEVASITHSSWLADTWLFSPNLFDAIKSGVYDIFVQGHSPFNNVLWTMTTEFAGSFLVFGFLALFGSVKRRTIGYIFLGIVTFNTWFFAFVAGMAIADLYANGYIAAEKRRLIILLPILTIIFFLGGYPSTSVTGTIYQYITFTSFDVKLVWQTVYLSFAAIGLVLIVLYSRQLSNFLKIPKISILGKYTFSLYLVHLIVLYTFGMALFLLLRHKIGFGYNLSAMLAIILSIPIVIGATILFEKFIDSPSIKFSSVFANALLNGYETKAIKTQILKPIRSVFAKIKKLNSRRPTEIPEEVEV